MTDIWLDAWRDDLNIWRDNLQAGIYLLENECASLDDLITFLVERGNSTEQGRGRSFLEESFYSARERGIQNFASRKAGWFFISVECQSSQTSQLIYYTTWYTANHGETVLLRSRCTPSLREDGLFEFIMESNNAIPHISGQRIIEMVHAAIAAGNKDSIDMIAATVIEDPVYGPLLRAVSGEEPHGEECLFPMIEYLAWSEHLIPNSGMMKEEDLLRKQYELLHRTFSTAKENREIEYQRDVALEDAQRHLFAVETKMRSRRES